MDEAKRTQIPDIVRQVNSFGGLDGLALCRIIPFRPFDDETLRQVCLDWIGRWRA